MRNFATLLISFAFLFASSPAFGGGGPDTFGYTWLDSNDPGGPSVTWADTNSNWTRLNGLQDDNSVGPLNIGWNFHYYWTSYNTLKVGSNGWLSFDNVGNVASCFPTLPTAGGAGDNLLAPLMSDLSFVSSYPAFPNVGEVYYWTNNVDSFVISYYNVPFWANAVPDWTGSSTFQVVLNGQDSSITFNYQTMNPTFSSGACATNLAVGIENLTGNIGLQPLVNAMPASNYAIKFEYPDSVLLSIRDVTPAWNQNINNGGTFYPLGALPPLQANIANVGNTDVTTTITVSGTIEDVNFGVLYNSTSTLPGLVNGASANVNFSPPVSLNTTGQYFFNTQVLNSQDINPSNNQNSVEFNMVDLSGASSFLSFATGGPSSATLSWSGGEDDDGAGVYIVPPIYPVTIPSIDYHITSTGTDYYIAQVYDDNGPNGSPGTLLYTDTIPASAHISNAWNTVTLSTPITVSSGGVYIGWFQGGSTVFLGTETVGPLSRRNYEVLAGQWAEYRENNSRDLLIRANITGYPCAVSSGFTFTPNANVVTFTNTSSGGNSFFWDFGDGQTSTIAGPTHTYATTGTYTVCLVTTGGCGSDTTCQTFTLSCPAPTAGFTNSSTGITVAFTDISGPNISSWAWDFGDGNTSTQQNPTHSYGAPGNYLACLIATSPCGADTFCDSVAVCALVSSNYAAIPNGLSVSFNSLASGGSTYNWDFGDGGTSSMQNPSYTYAAAGTYNVCLTVSNTCNADTFCSQVTVCAPEPANFGFTSTGVFNYSFMDQTNGPPTAWFWDFGDGGTSSLQNPTHTYATLGSYTVCLATTDNCGTDTSCQAILVVGLEDEQAMAGMAVWPNPATDRLQAEVTGYLPEGGTLRLLDALGRQVREQSLEEVAGSIIVEMDLHDLAGGMYFMELRGEGFVRTVKVLLDR